jgi:hypothetical protein
MSDTTGGAIRPEQFRELSEETKELVAFYEQNYEILVHYELPARPQKPLYVGSRNPRHCRFCGATDKKLFRKVAHAVPEALGNKVLLCLEECDGCNEFFGRELDQHFANFLGMKRTLWQIRGKTGVPKYAVPGRRPRLWQSGSNSFRAEAHLADDFIEIDQTQQSGKIKGFKRPYRKRAVFKSLVKSALAVMPQDELSNFIETIRWIRAEGPEKTPESRCFCFTSSMEVRRVGLEVLLMRRLEPTAKLPYMTFFMCFANLTYQVFLPFSKGDHHYVGETIQVRRFPNRASRIGWVRYGVLDLSSSVIVRDESDEIRFQIGEPGVIIERRSRE